MPKISVIIPIYNVEKYLKQCLDSVVNQTLKDIEIICVNDGSPDNCKEIIEEYKLKDDRIVAVHKKNGGYASAINYGLNIAQGEYIGIVESDDWITETMYEKLYEKAIQTSSDIVKGSFYYVKNSITNEMKISNWVQKIAKENPEPFSLLDYPDLISHFASIWSAIYKKSWLNQNNIRMNENIRPYEDIPFIAMAYSKAEKISVISDGVLFYRQDAQNSSNNTVKKVIVNYILQRAENRKILIENNCYTDEMIEKYWYVAYKGALSFYNKPNNKYRKEFYDSMKELFKLADLDKCSFKYFSITQKLDFKKIVLLPHFLYRLNRIFHNIIGFDLSESHISLILFGVKLNIKRKNKRIMRNIDE